MRRKNQSSDQHRHILLDYHGYFLGHFTSSKKIFMGIFEYDWNDCRYCFFLEFKKRNEVD
ncbi:hypothetical protein BH745_15790 [Enterococcus gallinarum]|nr:hypothetical protein BH745_15790 [Enterococcus gallinarum]